ncbi:hypothetical protein VC81_04295 [Levilactobacillus spicheri]|uniref:Uncharacterized protein n=1 Tax=Levilactobacillus spicheri TaxID=216463 RepID=A0A0F3RT76_9LACO|nr:hypothetical protein VC81_04295 [Levilactobacillus spicheri]
MVLGSSPALRGLQLTLPLDPLAWAAGYQPGWLVTALSALPNGFRELSASLALPDDLMLAVTNDDPLLQSACQVA